MNDITCVIGALSKVAMQLVEERAPNGFVRSRRDFRHELNLIANSFAAAAGL